MDCGIQWVVVLGVTAANVGIWLWGDWRSRRADRIMDEALATYRSSLERYEKAAALHAAMRAQRARSDP